MGEDTIVAIVAFAGVCVTAVLGYLSARNAKQKLRQAEDELRMQARGLDFSHFMQEWAGTYGDLMDLMHSTNVDRFMIFRAWNGSHSPRWTTAVFQLRIGNQMPMSYIHVDLDNHYVEMLREIGARRPTLLVTSEMPKCMLREVYEAEGVTSSYLEHIETANSGGSRSVAVTYCSFATHTGELSIQTVTRCRVIANRLRASALMFRDREDETTSP